MLERPQTGILQKKEIPAILNAMGQGRDSLAMDGITPSFALNFAEGGSIKNQAATATFTRATTATFVDHDSIVRTALSGEARMQGLRRVCNLMTNTEDFIGAWNTTTCTITPGVTDPLGGTTAATVTSTATSIGTAAFQQIGGATSSQKFVPSCWLKRRTGTGRVDLRTSDNVANTITTSLTTSWQRFSAPVAGPSGANAFFVLSIQVSGDAVDIWHPQLEDVTGQAVQNPGEYVSVGVLSAPYQGANVNGVQYFPTHNGNVVQQNLLLQSQTLENASWPTSNASVTANAVAAPDGTTTADKLIATVANTQHFIQQGTTVAGQQYTTSIYAKAGEETVLGIIWLNNSNGADFNLSSGTVVSSGTGIIASISPVGNGWYRCTMSGAAPSTNGIGLQLRGRAVVYLGDGVSGLYVWGAQLQLGRRAGTYVPTTTVAINNNIVEESAGDWISPSIRLGYLSEGARTNVCLQSEDFTTTWGIQSTAVTANATVGPDGLSTADKITELAAIAEHYENQAALNIAASQPITCTVYAKAAERNFLYLAAVDRDGTSVRGANFNLSTGAIVSTEATVTSAITSLANGWYRCSISYTLTAGATNPQMRVQVTADGATKSYLGVVNSGIYVWGAQAEQATFASSYIPTTTVAVTRNADVLNVSTITGFFNSTEGTLLAQWTPGATGQAYVFDFSDATGNELIAQRQNVSSQAEDLVLVGGATQAVIGATATTVGVTGKIVSAYKANDFATCFNGGVVNTDAAGSIPTVDRLAIGHFVGAQQLSGTIGKVAYYSRRLTNPQIVKLSI